METMAAAYGIVWLSVVLFVIRMALRQRKLRRSLELIGSRLPASPGDDNAYPRAA